MIYILFITLLAAILDYKSLMKQRMTREIIISGMLLVIGITLVILQLLHIHVPSPLVGLMALLDPIHQTLHAWMTS